LLDSLASGYSLIAPPLFEYEVESVLQERLHSGALTEAEVDTALTRLQATGVQITSHIDMVKRARAIARRFDQQRIYDSVYAALAELSGCEFWTADKAFFEAVKLGLPFVKYLGDYP
jgi:predicted nucleic acid-binding protein